MDTSLSAGLEGPPTIHSTHTTGPQLHCHSCGGDSTLLIYIWGNRLTQHAAWQLGRGHCFRRWEEGGLAHPPVIPVHPAG